LKSSSYRSKTTEEAQKNWEEKQKAQATKNKLKGVKEVIDKEVGIIDASLLDDPELPEAARTDLKNTPKLFEPLVNPTTGRSPQTEFLEAGEDEVLLSGGRGPLVCGESVLVDGKEVPIEQLRVGDCIDHLSNRKTVITDIPYEGLDDCLELTTETGLVTRCGEAHLYPVYVDGTKKLLPAFTIQDYWLNGSTVELLQETIMDGWQPVLTRQSISDIRAIGVHPVRCITVSAEDSLFKTNSGIITHNSGKSSALIAALLRPEYIGNRNYRALVIRRTMRELQDLISKAKAMCKDAVPGTKWRASENRIYFPSGAFLEFGYCEGKDDVERYRGREFCILAVDELTMIAEEDMYIALISSVRTTDPDLPAQVLCTTNPYGVGFQWVKNRFINQGPENSTIVVKYKNDYTGKTHYTTRKWITSNFMDNPLIKDSYVASLAALPEDKRKRWLEGTWDGGDGMAFPEFDRARHVVKPFSIPHSWPRFRACDWGYSTRAVTLWFALDQNEVAYIYREYCATDVNADVYARKVLELEKGEHVQYGVIDGSVGDKRGQPMSIEQLMRKEGCIWRYADKSQGSRLAGKMLMHQALADDQLLGEPKIQIFDTCTETIDSLSTLPADDKNPDDVDTKHKNDHPWDAIRFFLLSRPRYTSFFDKPEYKKPPPVINSVFGY
jgi:hypothetical protein